MGKQDPRIDAFINQSADFAKPILKHLRQLVHASCPEVQETVKWGMPFFEYKGLLCMMAAFKAHCTFGFWKGKLITAKPKAKSGESAMGQFGRLTSLSDLPADKVIAGYIKKAMALNEAGAKVPGRAKPKAKAKAPLVIPDYFIAALKKNKKALAAFEAFSYSHQKEYVQWVTEAKSEDTRQRRLETTVKWLTEGKSRNWKYERC